MCRRDRRYAAVYCGLLLLVAIPRDTLAACAEDIRFEDDGGIAEWDVCHGKGGNSFVAPGRARWEIELFLDGHLLNETLVWESVEDGSAKTSFRAFEARNGIDVRRVYESAAGGSLEHSISISNPSGTPVAGLQLRFLPGAPPVPGEGAGRSLADYMYRFHRTYIAAEGGRWRPADPDTESRVYASVSRHRIFVIEAAQEFALRQTWALAATADDAERGDRWSLEFDIPTLDPGESYSLRQAISALPASSPTLASAGYDDLLYADLWQPLALLCRWIERALAGLAAIAGNPAIAIVLLAALVRLVTLPVTAWSARRQDEFARVTARMKPEIAKVRKEYKGAEQSERILEIYRQNGVSPLSGLNGSLGLFVQIPFLLAVFNVTTVSSLFSGEAFLWIDDLSLPDNMALLPVSIPLLGDHLNALPLLLGGLFVFSAAGGAKQPGSSTTLPMIITSLIILAFYSFAAALVLYWLAVSAFQMIERVAIRKRRGAA